MRNYRDIDKKYHAVVIDGSPEIVKKTTAEPIPLDEPLFLIRARDQLAVKALMSYLRLCEVDGCTDYQLSAMREIINEFIDWQARNKSKLKQPGITKGL